MNDQMKGMFIQEKKLLNGHEGFTLWLTGLPASGKSTLANNLDISLTEMKCKAHVLDGDDIRKGLSSDLGFCVEDRSENIRRIAEVAKILNDAEVIAIVAFISPYQDDRILAKKIIGEDRFIEIFVDCPIDVCIKRDPKGHYKLANEGKIQNFTGVTDPYEIPTNPTLRVRTNLLSEESCYFAVIQFLKMTRYLSI